MPEKIVADIAAGHSAVEIRHYYSIDFSHIRYDPSVEQAIITRMRI